MRNRNAKAQKIVDQLVERFESAYTVSAGEFSRALDQWDQAARALGRFSQRWDLYVTPTGRP